MKGLKAIMVISTIIAAAIVLSACEKAFKDAAKKSGAGEAPIQASPR